MTIWPEDLRAVQAVRRDAGDEILVMADSDQGLLPVEAQRRLHGLDDHGLYWFEEPLPYTDLAGHARLTAQLRTPVQLGENFYGPEALAAAVRQRACHRACFRPHRLRLGDRRRDRRAPRPGGGVVHRLDGGG